MPKRTYHTSESLRKLQTKLTILCTQERPHIIKQIEEAKSKGDLSENAEYSAAKEAQRILEDKIRQLEEEIASSQILDPKKIDPSQVSIFTKVVVQNDKIGEEHTYHLVPSSEANIQQGKIAVDAPIGRGLVGKKVGDKATISVPAGDLHFTVKHIAIT